MYIVEIQSKGPQWAVKKCLKYIGVGHLGYRLNYNIVILITRVRGEQSQTMHGKIKIQDQRAKAAVTWAVVGRVESGFIDTG